MNSTPHAWRPMSARLLLNTKMFGILAATALSTRVGISAGSSGGYLVAAAILTHRDFFKVAVA